MKHNHAWLRGFLKEEIDIIKKDEILREDERSKGYKNACLVILAQLDKSDRAVQQLEIPKTPEPSKEYKKGFYNAIAYLKQEVLGNPPKLHSSCKPPSLKTFPMKGKQTWIQYHKAVVDWFDNFERKLQQLDLLQWCFDKGYGKLYATVLDEFRKEVLGETDTT